MVGSGDRRDKIMARTRMGRNGHWCMYKNGNSTPPLSKVFVRLEYWGARLI